jgi:hypothetical protein
MNKIDLLSAAPDCADVLRKQVLGRDNCTVKLQLKLISCTGKIMNAGQNNQAGLFSDRHFSFKS